MKDFNMGELLASEENKPQIKLRSSIFFCFFTALIVSIVISLIAVPLTKFGIGFKEIWVENGVTITSVSFPTSTITLAIVFIFLVLLNIRKSKSKAIFLGFLGLTFAFLIQKLLYLTGFADLITKSLQ
jgi:uncharacterized BrkB/YihY/UPF0761 family membrane protein